MKILEPITIGNVTLKNRLMFPPLTTGYEGRDGSITPQSLAFYKRLAEGGVSYIVLGDVNPVPSFSPTPRLCDDSQIDGFLQLTQVVHTYGGKIAAQIFYPEYDVAAMGALAATKDMGAVRQKLHYDMEHFTDEVTESQLLDILQKMVDCGVRAEKAGFDAIQIHGDRLLGTLCSTKMNHRTDEYGGTLENRTRFARMLVRALRSALPDMLLDYKLAIVTPARGRGGVDLEDALTFAQWLEKDGVDMLHVAQANHTGNLADTIPPMGVQPYGFFLSIAEQIKAGVQIPVSTVGRIVDPSMTESILTTGKADIVALGRPLLCDPDWIQKLTQGKPDKIRRCISCNKGCTDAIQNRMSISCVLNAENGFEDQRKIIPTKQEKKVVIVGGGVAGLEAARVCALRGHNVTLLEKDMALGGQLNIASIPPRKDELRRGIADLEYSAQQAGVDIRLGTPATQHTLLSLSPDAVLIAVGAANMMPPIPGANRKNVYNSWSVLGGKQAVYGQVVIIGGGLVGCETAEYLSHQGCNVTIVEMLPKIATGESVTVLPTLFESFTKYHVIQHTETTVQEIHDNEVHCVDKTGAPLILPCDCVVMAAGARPVPFESDLLKEKGISVVHIGDCGEKAADISNAIRTGYDAACAI